VRDRLRVDGNRMRDTGRRAAWIGTLAALACGGSAAKTPDFYVNGAGVIVASDAPFTRRPDLPARVESTVGAALGYWGGTWRDIEGRTITLEGSQHVACPGAADAIGCYDGDIRVSTTDVGSTFSCVEETVLVHEVGHAVIGDPDHSDPRWMDFSSLAPSLEGRTGYTASGEVACQIWVSVWQHPPTR
jgi:hypothetical protein